MLSIWSGPNFVMWEWVNPFPDKPWFLAPLAEGQRAIVMAWGRCASVRPSVCACVRP